MKIVTINIAEKMDEFLDSLVLAGRFPSRSEAIRVALRDFLGQEINLCHEIETATKELENYDL